MTEPPEDIDVVDQQLIGAGGTAGDPASAAGSPLSSSEAQTLFDEMASQEDIAFKYPDDGCYARAHLMTQRIEAKGITPKKVWAFENPDPLHVDTANHPSGSIEWWYHVAPTVPVEQPDGSVSNMVIDPSIFDGPVSIESWASAQHQTGGSSPFTTETELGEAPIGVGGIGYPGTGYWPGADPSEGVDVHAVETMEDYKIEESIRGH